MYFLLFLFAIPFQANSTVLNFDDLTGQGAMPASYGGFNWANWTYYDWSQPPYTAKSPSTRLYTLDASNNITSNTDFVFNGAWFSGKDYATVQFNLYNNSSLVWTSPVFNGLSAVPMFLDSGYYGLIDQIKITSNAFDYWVMDDFTYNAPNAVPIPAAALMFAPVLFGFLGYRRKLKNQPI